MSFYIKVPLDNRMLRIAILFGLILIAVYSKAGIYQWSARVPSMISSETDNQAMAFLWIPENCKQVKALVVGQHNMCEETIFDHSAFRETMAELDFAIVWITPGIDQQWDINNGCQEAFDQMLVDLAEISGYSELKYAPIVPLGHSALATFPWNFAAWNPNKTLAVISYKGDSPRTNLTGYGRENLEWGRTRNIDGIPGLMIEGEYEWWEARVNPALAFRMMYPESCISFLCDVGHGHFDVSDEVVNYLCLFLQKAAQYRLPEVQALSEPTHLIKLNPIDGWLAGRWKNNQMKRKKTAPYNTYKGNRHDAFWYFDKEMAEATEQYYKENQNRKMQFIGFETNGHLLPFETKNHAQYQISNIKVRNHVFNVKAVFTDSLHLQLSDQHAKGFLKIDRICGPVKKMNDSTFKVEYYRMGINNNKRSGDIWLLAHHPGNDKFKSSVQQINIKVPFSLMSGDPQDIRFYQTENVEFGTKSIDLFATSSSGLPVNFYVKEGPALIEGEKLVFTPIPPRSKFPVKVTVVAWQDGLTGKKEVQSAIPVEQSFMILKNK